MADPLHVENASVRGSRFHHVDLADSSIRDANLSGLDIRGIWAEGLRMRGAMLKDASIDGELDGLVVNGVDVTAYVEAELDRRDPRRAAMRPTTPAGFARAWDLVEELWTATVARARTLDPALLHERVDDEYSFIETLRHLVFATDCWVRRGIGGDPSPWHPLALPWEEAEDVPEVPWDRDARPGLDEMLAIRRERMDGVRRVIETLTPERLLEPIAPPDAPGWPTPEQDDPVGEALRTVLNEEWHHRLYAERDLDVLAAR